MTQKEQAIARKLFTAIENIETLVKESSNGVFYVSHLTQLSRLQREVIAEILVDMRFIEAIHSGNRSPYRVITTKYQWNQFVETLKNWALVTAGDLPKRIPDNLLEIEENKIEPSNITVEDINLIFYFSRLFGQARIAIASKSIITYELSRISPNGLTVDKIAEKLNLSRRTINEYLKEGFNNGFFAVCFPKDNLQSIGYRLDANADSLLKAWKSLIDFTSSIPVYALSHYAEEATISSD